MSDHQPEGTQLVTQLGDAVGGPEVPVDPETGTVDLRRKLWNVQRLGESMAGSGNLTIRGCGEQVLAVLGDAALLVAAVLDRPTIDGEAPGEAGLGDDTSGALATANAASREGSDGSDEKADEPHMDLLETAWGVIANAGWDDCAKTPGWQEAAVRWRESYHRWLDLHLRPGGYQTWEELAVGVTRERDALAFEAEGLRRALRNATDAESFLPVGAAFDREALRRAVSAVVDAPPWEPQTTTGARPSERVMEAIWPLLERAVAAEGKLAAVRQRAESWASIAPEGPDSPVLADAGRDILAIIGTEEESHG